MTTKHRRGPKASPQRQIVETRFDEVVSLRAQGKTAKEIAAILGVKRSHVQTVLQVRRVFAPKRGLPVDQELLVKELYLSKVLPRTIAERLGLPVKQVRCFVAKNVREKMPDLPKIPLFGKNNPSWKGGAKRFRKGYAYIPNGELDVRGRTLYVLEHRLLMERHLGRKLLRSEVVHHMNGDHTDNRVENLMIFPTNGEHLHHELSGKCPNWTAEGKSRILAAVRNRKATFRKHPTGSVSVQLGQLLLPM